MHYAANIRVYDLDIAGADKRGRAGPRGTEHVLAKYTGKSGYNIDPSSSRVFVRGCMTKPSHEGDHDD